MTLHFLKWIEQFENNLWKWIIFWEVPMRCCLPTPIANYTVSRRLIFSHQKSWARRLGEWKSQSPGMYLWDIEMRYAERKKERNLLYCFDPWLLFIPWLLPNSDPLLNFSNWCLSCPCVQLLNSLPTTKTCMVFGLPAYLMILNSNVSLVSTYLRWACVSRACLTEDYPSLPCPSWLWLLHSSLLTTVNT